ncbi:hypothetical protein T439DRAFT_221273 [Meredithblackwellia eburnea MCA 4105]
MATLKKPNILPCSGIAPTPPLSLLHHQRPQTKLFVKWEKPTTMYSNRDLAALLCGWISFGFSMWSYAPTVFGNIALKPPEGGLNFWMLYLWLLGDMMLFFYYFFNNGLAPQFISVAWFAAIDVLVICQQLLYHGTLPAAFIWCGTREYRVIILKQVESGTFTLTLPVTVFPGTKKESYTTCWRVFNQPAAQRAIQRADDN